MQKILVAVCALLSLAATEDRREIEMDCEPAHSVSRVPHYIDGYEVVKQPFRREDGRWDARYAVHVTFKSDTSKEYEYALSPTGSSEGSYLEYEVVATQRQMKAINVKGAYINRRFTSASLVDPDGVEFVDCGIERH